MCSCIAAHECPEWCNHSHEACRPNWPTVNDMNSNILGKFHLLLLQPPSFSNEFHTWAEGVLGARTCFHQIVTNLSLNMILTQRGTRIAKNPAKCNSNINPSTSGRCLARKILKRHSLIEIQIAIIVPCHA